MIVAEPSAIVAPMCGAPGANCGAYDLRRLACDRHGAQSARSLATLEVHEMKGVISLVVFWTFVGALIRWPMHAMLFGAGLLALFISVAISIAIYQMANEE